MNGQIKIFILLSAMVVAVGFPLDLWAWSPNTPADSPAPVIAPGANQGGGPVVWTTNEGARITTFTTSPNTYAKIENPDPDDPDEGPSAPLIGFLIFSAPSLVTGSTTALGVIITGMGMDGTTAENYLRENAVALRHDLRRGAGDTLEDLAYLWGIDRSHYPRFAAIAHERRHKLLPHLNHPFEIDRSSTYAFLLAIGYALAEEPEITAAILRR